MDETEVGRLLEAVRDGRVQPSHALKQLKTLPIRQSMDVNLDAHRRLRRGLPEVIFAQGKSDEQLLTAVRASIDGNETCLVTRVDPHQAELIRSQVGTENLEYSPVANIICIQPKPVVIQGRGTILIASAGSSDVPVAEEAALTCEALGNRTERTYDVGVAGLHRLLENFDAIQEAAVIIVAAGMEGALPSVVAGLAPCPVVAVPTSVGYGASFGGIAALLAMLNSCAGGVTVVNIDNGFGAGVAASLINRKRTFDQPEGTD